MLIADAWNVSKVLIDEKNWIWTLKYLEKALLIIYLVANIKSCIIVCFAFLIFFLLQLRVWVNKWMIAGIRFLGKTWGWRTTFGRLFHRFQEGLFWRIPSTIWLTLCTSWIPLWVSSRTLDWLPAYMPMEEFLSLAA